MPDLLLDLADIYGNAFPRPRGRVIQFTLVDERTTYSKALAKIQGVLQSNGVEPVSLTVNPGPETPALFNRSIVLLVAKDDLM